MRIFIIFNPRAGSAAQAEVLRQHLQARGDVTLAEPGSRDETRRCAAQALRDGHDVIVAAGGDGTVHAVVNGLAPDFGSSRLAILPLGTGNDLRRTLAIPEDPLEALPLLEADSERLIDLVRVETASRTSYGVNVCSGGFSGQVEEVLTEEMKSTWGPLAYLRGAMAVLPNLTDYHTRLVLDGSPAERVEVLNIIVANGRYAAKGWEVAPRANPEDGLLDVVVIRSAPLLDLTALGTQLLAGDYLQSEHVLFHRARQVHVTSMPGMWFSIDGELLGNEPITFTVQPRALRVVVGPDYRPEPAPASGPLPVGPAG